MTNSEPKHVLEHTEAHFQSSTIGLDPKPEQYLDVLEDIRRRGAIMMGLAKSIEAAAAVRGTPKIALVSKPSILSTGTKESLDTFIRAMSIGQPQPGLQLTGAV